MHQTEGLPRPDLAADREALSLACCSRYALPLSPLGVPVSTRDVWSRLLPRWLPVQGSTGRGHSTRKKFQDLDPVEDPQFVDIVYSRSVTCEPIETFVRRHKCHSQETFMAIGCLLHEPRTYPHRLFIERMRKGYRRDGELVINKLNQNAAILDC